MKYFDEKKMEPIRKEFEKTFMKWMGVSSRPMMDASATFTVESSSASS